MVGVAVEAGIDVAARALGRLSEDELHAIMDAIGGLVTDQTDERFEAKTEPEGGAWAPWSEHYAATRHAGHSLLIAEDHLRGSVQQYIDGSGSSISLHVGTNRIYGAIHQFGSEDGSLPARPYLGLSADNRAAIEALVIGRIEDLLQ